MKLCVILERLKEILPVVLQDTRCVYLPKSVCDSTALVLCESDSTMAIIHADLTIKVARICFTKAREQAEMEQSKLCGIYTLCEHFNWFSKCGPCLAMYAMSVDHGRDIWTGMVDFGVNHESRLIDHRLIPTLNYIAFGIYQHHIGCLELIEMYGERIHPKVIR